MTRANLTSMAGRFCSGLMLVLGFPGLVGACQFLDYGEEEGSKRCSSRDDCERLDDGDPCFGEAYCDSLEQTCKRDFFKDDEQCQCRTPADCTTQGMQQLGCNLVTCTAGHICQEEILPAGPSPAEVAGDCLELTCDGRKPEAVETADLEDIADDDNACSIDTCTDSGPQHQPLGDGAVCGEQGEGVCFKDGCTPGCPPQNPEACGDEGSREPMNDDPSDATVVAVDERLCGMLDGDDVDWFEAQFADQYPGIQTAHLGFLSTNSATEICAYARCDNGGFPGGDCGDKHEGPNGSHGCCWTGNQWSLDPFWPLDCEGTDDDSATVLFSIRTPEGDACESYRIALNFL